MLSYAVHNKHCSTRAVAELSEKAAPDHDCRQKRSRSAKAMEPDAAVQLALEAKEQRVRYI